MILKRYFQCGKVIMIIENSPYSKKEKNRGYFVSDDVSTKEMYADRKFLAPFDIFCLHNSPPKIYENILSEDTVDNMIDWLLKNYHSRRPNKHGGNAHFSEKDIVFFLTHDYKNFVSHFWNNLKDVIPFYDSENDFVSGNFYWTIRGYDLHHDYYYHQDYMKKLKNNPKIKYIIPYKSLIIPLFSMGLKQPPYNLYYTTMKERVYGFGQTMGDVMFELLKEKQEDILTEDSEGFCVYCKNKKTKLVNAQGNINYKLCKSCLENDKVISKFSSIKETNVSIYGNIITGRYKKLASRPKEFFYDLDNDNLEDSLNKFHFCEDINKQRWRHITLGTLFGFREDETFRWRGGDIICQDSNQIHISSNLDKVKSKAGLMINISKPIYHRN